MMEKTGYKYDEEVFGTKDEAYGKEILAYRKNRLYEGRHMRKTLQDVASYLKEIMVPETQEAYVIKPAYTDILQIEKTIIANGGVFEKEVFVDGDNIKRYWITL